MKIGIIGGGISGNYIQKELKKKGVSSIIFEKEPTVGGLAKLINLENNEITLGPHIYPINFLKKMNLTNYTSLSPNEGFIYNKKFIKSNMIIKYFPELIFTAFKMLFKYPANNMDDYFNFYFGKRVKNKLLKSLFEKWMGALLRDQRQVKSFININLNMIAYYIMLFFKKKVFGNYQGNFAKDINQNPSILYEKVVKIERKDNCVSVITEQNKHTFDYIFLTVDLNTQQKLIYGNIKKYIPYRHSVFVFKQNAKNTPFIWVYDTTKNNRIFRITNYKKLYPNRNIDFLSYEFTINDKELPLIKKHKYIKVLKNSYPVISHKFDFSPRIFSFGRTGKGRYQQVQEMVTDIDKELNYLPFL